MTPFGNLLRRERQDRGLLLGDLAKMLKISVPYLSQLETGVRFVPDGFEDKVIKTLGLGKTEAANEMHRAAANSRSQYSLTMNKDATTEDRALANELVETFARLTPEAKAKLRRVLEENRRGK